MGVPPRTGPSSGVGQQEDVVSRTWTNLVRFAVAALLGLAACLVAWWPQSAAGSGDTLTPVAAAPTQNTPTPTRTPTATVAPTRTPTATVAPPTQAPPPPSTPKPTKKPTKKPTQKPTQKPTHRPNSNGGNHSNSNGGGKPHQPSTPKPPRPTQSTSTSSGGSTYTPPPPATAPATQGPTKPAKPTTSAPPTEAPTTPASPSTQAAGKGDKPKGDKGDQQGDEYDAYLTSSEPVEAKSAPVWVVPGILLVLTSMLALLGGVLGRGNRPALARVKASNENPSGDDS